MILRARLVADLLSIIDVKCYSDII